jgi:hypothetical protein
MSDTQKQIIQVEYQASEAQQAAAKFATDEQRRIKEMADAAKKAAKEIADAQKKAFKDAADVQKKMDKEAADAAKKADKERLDSHAAVNRLLKEQAKEETSAAQTAARNRTRATKEGTREELLEIRNKHKVAMMQWKWEQEALAKQQAATQANIGAVQGYVAAYAGFGAIVGAVRAVAEYMDQIRRDTIEAAKEVIGFRREVLALAAMKGQLGQSTPETVAQLKFRGATLQTRADALALSQAAAGAGQAALGKNLTGAAFEEGKIAAGKLQALEGDVGAGGAYGALYGTLALEAKKGTTGRQMAGQFAKEFQIQQPGTFVNMAQYAHQRQMLSPFVQTGALSGSEASALVSALSLEMPPDQAATAATQILSSTSADFMRARGMKTLPGTEHETSAAYFQGHLGLKTTATSKEIWEAAADDIIKESKKPGWIGADKYLASHGLTNAEARRGYAAMSAVRAQGQWGQFQELIDAPLDPSSIYGPHAARAGREPVLLERKTEIAHDAMAMQRGTTAEGGLAQIQQLAFERLKAEGKIAGTFDEWKGRGYLGQAWDTLTSGRESYHEQVNVQAQTMLAAEAQRVGVGFHIPTSVNAQTGARTTGYMGDEALFRLQEKVQAAGGDPMAAVAADVKRAADAMERFAAAAEGKPAPGPVAAKGPAAVAAPLPGPQHRAPARAPGAP